jgi:hypothetical protein
MTAAMTPSPGQLQRIIIGADAAEQLDDSPSVTTIYRCPQGRALLL